jgi:uncharacterized protein
MDRIYIPQLLKAPQKTERLELRDFVSGLESLNPVRGEMKVYHGGTYLEVTVKADTIVTLTCDRCLKQYNHRLAVETVELIWLEEISDSSDLLPLEREVQLDDLTETLDPQGYFDPEAWLYEQLSLEMPMRSLCGEDCEGLPKTNPSETETAIDSRWASLESLKKQFFS